MALGNGVINANFKHANKIGATAIPGYRSKPRTPHEFNDNLIENSNLRGSLITGNLNPIADQSFRKTS
jgi:hypothetical protein